MHENLVCHFEIAFNHELKQPFCKTKTDQSVLCFFGSALQKKISEEINRIPASIHSNINL